MITHTATRALTLAMVTTIIAVSCSTPEETTNEAEVDVKIIDDGQTRQAAGVELPGLNAAGSVKQLEDETPEGTTRPGVFGERNEGELENPFETDIWTFEGSEGQAFTLELHNEGTCHLDAQIALKTPSGERFEILPFINGDCTAHGPIELEEAGEYAVEFIGGGGDLYPATGNYIFTPRLS